MSEEDWKILGELADAEGSGILGRNTATSGAAVGVRGETAAENGYGLYTDDDAHVGGGLTAGTVDADTLASRSRPGQAVLYVDDDGVCHAVDEDGELAAGDNHSAVVQAALDQRGEVLFKQGVFEIGDPLDIPANAVVRGSGRSDVGADGAVAVVKPDPNWTPESGSADDYPLFRWDGGDLKQEINTVVSGVTISGQADLKWPTNKSRTARDLISLFSGYNVVLRDSVLVGTTGRAIDLNHTQDCWVVRTKIQDCGRDSVPQVALRVDAGDRSFSVSESTNGIRLVQLSGGPRGTYVSADANTERNYLLNCRMELSNGRNGSYVVDFDAESSHNQIRGGYYYGGQQAAVKLGTRCVMDGVDVIGTYDGVELAGTHNEINGGSIKAYNEELGDEDDDTAAETQTACITGPLHGSRITGVNLTGVYAAAGIDGEVTEKYSHFLISGVTGDNLGGDGIVVSGSGSVRTAVISGCDMGFVGRNVDTSTPDGEDETPEEVDAHGDAYRIDGVDNVSIYCCGAGAIGRDPVRVTDGTTAHVGPFAYEQGSPTVSADTETTALSPPIDEHRGLTDAGDGTDDDVVTVSFDRAYARRPPLSFGRVGGGVRAVSYTTDDSGNFTGATIAVGNGDEPVDVFVDR